MYTDTLSRNYNNPKDPGSLCKVEWLLWRARQLNVFGVTEITILKYLRSEQAYTLHKPARRQITRNYIYVAGIDAQWQADIADMPDIARLICWNRYFLTVIDVFFKFVWTIPVHFEDAKAIRAAVKQMLTTVNPRYHGRQQKDNGTKFFNSDFHVIIMRHGI